MKSLILIVALITVLLYLVKYVIKIHGALAKVMSALE